jgi:cell division cycle 2-like
MASKTKSRWADDEEEDAGAIAQRKKEKEERKRAKEERSRKVEPHYNNAQTSNPGPTLNGSVDRPSKRLKTLEEEGQSEDGVAVEPKLLTFPTKRFGACRNVEEYDRLNEIEEGSYGLVSRARERATGAVVALKKLKMDYVNDGFPVTGLREIQTLTASKHPHIVRLREVVMGSTLKE